MSKVKYNWATLGVGVIGHQLAEAIQKLGGNLYSVGNRTHSKAVEFAKKYNIKKVYDQPEDIFSDENVDIVYISTPHNTHINFYHFTLNNLNVEQFHLTKATLKFLNIQEVAKRRSSGLLIIAVKRSLQVIPLKLFATKLRIWKPL